MLFYNFDYCCGLHQKSFFIVHDDDTLATAPRTYVVRRSGDGNGDRSGGIAAVAMKYFLFVVVNFTSHKMCDLPFFELTKRQWTALTTQTPNGRLPATAMVNLETKVIVFVGEREILS